MSREAYQVPTGQTGYTGAGGVVEGTTSDAISVTYVCGDCNSRVSMKRGDQIRCKECGHRVLYKERTKRFVAVCIPSALQATNVLGPVGI
ncbi:DNA-directed RNA polymerase I, II, and III subunit RPABC4 [Blastomyces gilchristii SLH14081]|uniref:DNA-directed RNA polymerase I, II, and III subunit RPABC4 n=1 Tax=Blastomyces gilchristii (strain SLH14081) TaxID=559298 RepID=A0A179UUQ6_BLAGS|nr:DNA-directed RNA polymerase I, II, and III subunit RPABC4 [Blastomyces gilchristii SLH14081]EQL34467.1 DNA-directed RNA polymerase I, II, and III subunit RPABC4 [Blastomyces dermatitidis ATCC 26199]OAT11856.1 DNA-directed RNA polymerase I, II, and III subunit RPABC4 [Blastomyces gilchristii SLH14081]